MAYFNKNNRGGGDRFGKRGGFGGRSERPQMHDAICGKCGKQCQVPFRPTGERPVYCSDCFDKERDGGSERDGGRNFDRKDRGGRNFEERRMYSATCSNCGKKCEVPFLPTGGRPTYCNDCFGSAGAGGDLSLDGPSRDERPKRSFDDRKFTDKGGSRGADYTQQFNALNAKLDKLITLLAPKETAKPAAEAPKEKAPAKKAPAKKAVAPKKAKKK
ncbi:MAG: CxxC-x17-CxxC domain-containing protein [Patescibacteria group bacterium]